MNRIERRLLRINDEILRLQREEEIAEAELNLHRHLADDAVRDAAVYGGLEQAEARDASKDVTALQRALEETRSRLRRLEEKREGLLRRLDASR
jgi:HEPN domain-containing protein